ncbi:MAG: CPBP family intramembrane metalloprotease [Planctomycetaceae bacterium]|nr:MAG: CPBP family intramembrane metalloprotease [Planctomycetaceae bacterium]
MRFVPGPTPHGSNGWRGHRRREPVGDQPVFLEPTGCQSIVSPTPAQLTRWRSEMSAPHPNDDQETRLPDAPPRVPGDADEVFRNAILIELGLGFVALFLGWLTGVDVRRWLPELAPGQAWPILVASGWGLLAALPMIVVVEALQRIDWAPLRELHELDRSPLVATLLSLRPMELIAISIAAGVGEELLVRGWLMAWWIGPLESATPVRLAVALIGSALVFGLMHPVTPIYVVLATLMGIYLGWVVIWTENLLIAIVAHAAYDAVQLLDSRRRRLAESGPAVSDP